jgi:hypothetical protein
MVSVVRAVGEVVATRRRGRPTVRRGVTAATRRRRSLTNGRASPLTRRRPTPGRRRPPGRVRLMPVGRTRPIVRSGYVDRTRAAVGRRRRTTCQHRTAIASSSTGRRRKGGDVETSVLEVGFSFNERHAEAQVVSHGSCNAMRIRKGSKAGKRRGKRGQQTMLATTTLPVLEDVGETIGRGRSALKLNLIRVGAVMKEDFGNETAHIETTKRGEKGDLKRSTTSAVGCCNQSMQGTRDQQGREERRQTNDNNLKRAVERPLGWLRRAYICC